MTVCASGFTLYSVIKQQLDMTLLWFHDVAWFAATTEQRVQQRTTLLITVLKALCTRLKEVSMLVKPLASPRNSCSIDAGSDACYEMKVCVPNHFSQLPSCSSYRAVLDPRGRGCS